MRRFRSGAVRRRRERDAWRVDQPAIEQDIDERHRRWDIDVIPTSLWQWTHIDGLQRMSYTSVSGVEQSGSSLGS